MIATVSPFEFGQKPHPIAYALAYGELLPLDRPLSVGDMHDCTLIIVFDRGLRVWKDAWTNCVSQRVTFREAWDMIADHSERHKKWGRSRRIPARDQPR